MRGLAILFLLISFGARAQEITALDVIERIRANVKPQWVKTPTDTIVMGNGNTRVTGIATCMFLEMDILQKAVEKKINLIITHEPAFYSVRKPIDEFLLNDPVLKAKKKFIEDHNLVVFWFHDNAHFNQPDHIMAGLAEQLGWKIVSYRPTIVEIEKQPLSKVVRHITSTLNLPPVRVMGDPSMPVTKIGFVPGLAPTLEMHLGLLSKQQVDMVLVGEAREWEDYLYVRDALLQGNKLGAVFIGHLRSEEQGARYAAKWMASFVKEVSVEFIPNGEFWRVEK